MSVPVGQTAPGSGREGANAHLEPAPPELVEVLRSGLPGLAEEIYTAVRATVPDYAVEDGAQPSPERVVRETMRTYMARFADPEEPLDGLLELLHSFGRKEVTGNRSLESLHAAIHIAFDTSWHRITEVCVRNQVSGADLARVAEFQMAFMDQIIEPIVEAYLGQTLKAPVDLVHSRRLLMRALSTRPAASREVLEHLAAKLGWHVPETATPVAVRRGTRWRPAAARRDVLSALGGPAPWLLVPGEVDEARSALLGAALDRGPVAVGLTVPLDEVPDALRWARGVLALAEDGVIDARPLVRAEDHLLDLWLTCDPPLVEELARRRLGGLAALPEAKGRALTETLRVWLEQWSTAADVGRRLHLHPQTVRYRLRQIRKEVGGPLDDPETRFVLEAILKAGRRTPPARPAS
ncbi:CdaR family transcriptional regulator [Actinomadura sp. WMMA1423]|uniref:PucR family transcriptional regulator n=1 Tax=Actinomadura sp. WMMA1423 TaxID=2591108 RepID=UPI0011466892|nr:PucR family transcriptional regulator [Actinomadura sp. WMMA1423]